MLGNSSRILSFITRLPQLKRLALSGLADIQDFTPLERQPALKSIYLEGCTNLTSLDALRPLIALRRLTLGSASLPAGSIDEIVNAWPHLDVLQLIETDWITRLDPVTVLPLEVLTISRCPKLTDITPVEHLTRLEWLVLAEIAVSDLRPIIGLSRLKTLGVGHRDHVIDLTPIACLPKLRRLRLYEAAKGTDLTPLAAMHNLTIEMYEDQHVQGIEHLHRSTRIEWRHRD